MRSESFARPKTLAAAEWYEARVEGCLEKRSQSAFLNRKKKFSAQNYARQNRHWQPERECEIRALKPHSREKRKEERDERTVRLVNVSDCILF